MPAEPEPRGAPERPLGGDDRRMWMLAGAVTLLLVVVGVIVAVAASRGPAGERGGAATGSAIAGSSGSTTSPPTTFSAAPASPSSPAATSSPAVGPPPPPLAGPDDAGPATVPLSDPNGPVDVARSLFGSSGVACGSAHDTYLADCAVTRRFGQRLHQLYGAGQPYEPLCRCQQAWNQVSFAPGDPGSHAGDANHAAVDVELISNGRRGEVTLMVERTASGWLANDTWCGTVTAADIYVPQPPGCGAP